MFWSLPLILIKKTLTAIHVSFWHWPKNLIYFLPSPLKFFIFFPHFLKNKNTTNNTFMKKKNKKRTTPTTRTNNNNNPISSNNNKEKRKTNLQTKSNHLQHLHSYSNLKYKTFKNSNSSSQKHQQHSIYLRKIRNWCRSSTLDSIGCCAGYPNWI